MNENAEEHVERWSPRRGSKKKIKSHLVTKDYALHMNGVDRKDHDIADWTISLKSNKFYMRIFYWLLDSVLHAMYCVVKAIANDSNHPWYKYKNKNTGRFRFQMDLGMALINYGLEKDWPEPHSEKTKPKYVRKQNYIPCGCQKCFFCIKGKTHGIDHLRKGKKRATSFRLKQDCVKERICIGKPQYCSVCYQREKTINPNITSTIARKKCKQTRLGCPGCNEGKGVFVCQDCWPAYEHTSKK